MKSKINPNALCLCGSGKKHKQCCGAVDAAPKKNWYGLLIPFVVVLGVVGFMLHSTVKSDSSAPTSLGSGLGSGGPRSGGAPGQVWSQEHGHWHDAPSPASSTTPPPLSAPGRTTAPAPGTLVPPPEVIPEGKYWDPAHGHFHDIQPVDAGAGGASVALPDGVSTVVEN